MKNISNALSAHLGQELTTLAELVRITRRDGVVVAFTSHDADLVFGDVTYHADGAFSADKLIQNTELKARDFEVVGLMDSDLIDENDLVTGLYDHARVDVFLCNWADLSQGTLHIRRGWLGEVSVSGGRYAAGLRGFHDLLTRKVGEAYTPECRFCFGDARCAVDKASYTFSGFVTATQDARTFFDTTQTQASGAFDNGLLTWTSGASAGLGCEVCTWDLSTGCMTLWLPMTKTISYGDTYEVVAGCDKRFSTCRTRFGNAVNYGGFPYLPGIGKIMEYPDG